MHKKGTADLHAAFTYCFFSFFRYDIGIGCSFQKTNTHHQGGCIKWTVI